jgi:hypothetical protein
LAGGSAANRRPGFSMDENRTSQAEPQNLTAEFNDAYVAPFKVRLGVSEILKLHGGFGNSATGNSNQLA